ncbi:MAG: JAB domain-containing protein [Lachnospiraceae bacterium]|nr:JAB domain-containing protein [Lachnospiraceae bacterium]
MENDKLFHLDQVSIRMVEAPPLASDYPINSPKAAIKLMADILKDYDREVVAVINLRPDLKPINMNIVSMGALDQSLIHPRELMKSTILSNASSLMIVHNHTTGRVSPSKEDIKVTDRMNQVCTLLGVSLVDHIIVGPGDSYFSFHEKGELPLSKIHLADSLEEIEMEGMKVAETATLEKTKKEIVSFTVAECGEFHDLGELHENVATLKEAIALFDKIPPERMNGIPSIGIRVSDANAPEIFSEIDVMTSKRIDVDVLGYVPEIGGNGQAQYAVAEMIHTFPDKEIIGEISESIQKKVQIIESREKQSEQLMGVMDQLEKGVQDVFASDDYKNLLNVMAKMPKYSLNNMLLIAMQTQGKASMCQSFTGWKSMGRFVKKGEKGLKILAPSPYTIQREQNKVDQATGKVMMDKDGEPLRETVDIKMNAFKVVSTFDVSQTDGKELPSLGVSELVGNIEGYPALLEALKQTCPVPVDFEDIQSGAKGYYHQIDKRIAIQEGMSEAQTVKTLIHEMAHQKLHALPDVAQEEIKSRNSKEVEAESVAYVVCEHFGINTSDYSFGYVAGWSDGKETTELKASLTEIRGAASEMITAIDQAVEKELDAVIETGTVAFTKIYMEDPEKGQFMLEEHAGNMDYDTDISADAVAEARKIVTEFNAVENHTEAEISQVGKELLTINQNGKEPFHFNGVNLLNKAEAQQAIDKAESQREVRDVAQLIKDTVEKVSPEGKAKDAEPKEQTEEPRKKPSVKKKLQTEKEAVAKKPATKAKTTKSEERA